MNPLHATQMKTKNSSRSGLSIIEVLTSIVVAMIGVFGVMILIPFAVKQAKVGLDSDAAVMMGQNADAQFEISGYRNPTNWGVYRPGLGAVTAYSPHAPTAENNAGGTNAADFPEILSIDPLGVLENGGANVAALFANATFPFNGVDAAGVAATNPYPANLVIRPATLGTPSGAVMGLAGARRFMRSSDDLVFGEPVADLQGPEQVFDIADGTGDFLRRQSQGHLSWSAIIVPYKPDSTTMGTTHCSYKMYILVYKNRATLLPTKPENQMATAMVTTGGIQSPVSNIQLDPEVAVVEGVVGRDDWVMLINRSTLNMTDDGPPPTGVTFPEKGFDRQVAFYRVINASNRYVSSTVSIPASLTLDGPDFMFSHSDPSKPALGPTYVVHLKNVVSVYERTFEPEFESNWAF